MAKKLEELRVYQAANISEGFDQPTDAAFVQYLFHAKASLAEVLSRLREVRFKKRITQKELVERLDAGEKLSRGLAAFIRYLDGCGWKDRGRYKSRKRREQQAKRRGRRRRTDDAGLDDRGPDDRGTDAGTDDRGTDDRGTTDAGTDDRGTRDQGTKN